MDTADSMRNPRVSGVNWMSRGKRLTVWAGELIAQLILLQVALLLITEAPGHSTARLFAGFSFEILLFFCFTGYTFTTAISRFFWNMQPLWSYPVLSAMLFWLHFEIMNYMLGGDVLGTHYRLLFILCGMGIAFVSSLVGSFVLEQWHPRGAHP